MLTHFYYSVFMFKINGDDLVLKRDVSNTNKTSMLTNRIPGRSAPKTSYIGITSTSDDW